MTQTLVKDYGGGREYFDDLFKLLEGSVCIKGRFRNEHSRRSHTIQGVTHMGMIVLANSLKIDCFLIIKQWDFLLSV